MAKRFSDDHQPLQCGPDDLIERTHQVWQPRLGRDLSREDVRQIAGNLSGFFSILAEWSRAEMPPAGGL
jgi:hypothetical protein